VGGDGNDTEQLSALARTISRVVQEKLNLVTRAGGGMQNPCNSGHSLDRASRGEYWRVLKLVRPAVVITVIVARDSIVIQINSEDSVVHNGIATDRVARTG